jgi:predicted dehydrogenase
MKKEKKHPSEPEGTNYKVQNSGINRRNLLKAMAGIPVLGFFAFEVFRKWDFDQEKKTRIIKELELENMQAPLTLNKPSGGKGDLLRIGIIGFGNRAVALAKGLGYMHPTDVEILKENNTLADWLTQVDLNVALTGICDVFDLHAEKGLETALNTIRPGGETGKNLPVKRYLHYQEMLADKNIDAVIIATPDHHHAKISIDAAKAGKHIYCEKSIALSEDELNELYRAVKDNHVTYQLGHQLSQNVIFKQAKEVIKKNILGDITLIETTTNRNSADGAWIRHLDAKGNPKPGNEKTIDWLQWLGSRPYKPFSTDRYYNWTKWFDYDMGMIGQLFTHEFDAVNQLLGIGIPASVVCSGGIYYWKDNREIPDVLNAVFEYPDRDLSLVYSASLASGRQRGRVLMGHDAAMELGESLSITADPDSTRYKKQIEEGIINTSEPMVSFIPNYGNVDAFTSATSKYYASKGLITTDIDGRQVDLVHLHLREWLHCIRNGETPSANIDRAYEEGVACLMANISYLEKRRVEWDAVNRKIV